MKSSIYFMVERDGISSNIDLTEMTSDEIHKIAQNLNRDVLYSIIVILAEEVGYISGQETIDLFDLITKKYRDKKIKIEYNNHISENN